MIRNLLLLFACGAFLADAQAQDYLFSRSTRTYTPLNTANRFLLDSFSSLDTMFKTSFRIPYFKRLMGDSVMVDGSLLYLTEGGLTGSLNDELGAIEADIRPRSNGTAYIAHSTEGSTGNRIFKIEYHNMGFYDDTTHNDSVSYQVWLYENGNIEFHYGPSSVKNPASWYDGESGPATYLLSWDPVNETVMGVSGNPANPTVYYKWDDYAPLNSMPAPNTVYTFTPAFTGSVQIHAQKQFRIATEDGQQFRILGTKGNPAWKVYDALGRIVEEGRGTEIQLSHRSGVYRLVVSDELRSEVHCILLD